MGLRQKNREECDFYAVAQSKGVQIDSTCYTTKASPIAKVFIWGDSHAQHLNFGLATTLPSEIALLQVATSACPVELGIPNHRTTTYCIKSNEFALEIIRKEKPDVVIIAQHDQHDAATMRSIATFLNDAGVGSVIVLGPIPQWKPDLYKIVATRYWPQTPTRLFDGLDPRILELEREFREQLRRDEPFVYVDLFDFLCNEEGCLTMVGADRPEGLITADYGHLSPVGSVFIARNLLAPLILRSIAKPIHATKMDSASR